MNVFRCDKFEIEYDSDNREFILTINDKYGHYIDSTKVDREDIQALYKSLDDMKNMF